MPPRTATPEKQKKNARNEAWNVENTRRVRCRFNLRTDADILARLDAVSNVQGYIKALIRADIAAGNPVPDLDPGKEE